MENRAHALLAGLFTLLLGTAAGLALWWFSGKAEEFTLYELVSTRSIVGLNPQAPVRFQGVNVGRVSKISLEKGDKYNVIITIRVRPDVVLTRNTHARSDLLGITGTSYILLSDDGKDPTPLIGEGDKLPRIALQGSAFSQISDSGRDILTKLQTSTEQVNKLLSDQNIQNTSELLKNLANTSARMQKTLDLTNALLEDSRRFSTPENAKKTTELLAQAQQISKELPAAIAKFSQAAQSVNEAGTKVSALSNKMQEGTVPQLDQTLVTLQSTLTQLNQVLGELSKSPQSILTGHQPGQAGPGEVLPQ